MATFSDVVEQLKANNRSEAGRDSIHTREMRLTRETLENLIDETTTLRENTSATQEAVISQTDNQLTPSQIEENEKNQNANDEKNTTLLSKIAGGIGGIAESGKKAAGTVGKGLLGILKGTLLAGLLIGVAKFLQSETFQKITKFLFETVMPALKEFYDNVIVPVGNALLEFFNTTVKPALIGVKDFFMQDVFPFLKDLIVNDIMPFVKKVYGDIIEPSLIALKDFFMQDVFPALKTFIKEDVIPFINDAYDNVIKPAFDSIKEFVKNELFPAIGRAFKRLGEIYDKLKPHLEKLKVFLKETTLPILFETLRENFEIVKDIFSKLADFLINVIDGDFTAAFDNITDIGGLIVKAIDNAISGVLKMFGLEFEGNVSDVIGRFFDSIFNKIDNAINSVLQSVENTVRAIVGDTVADKIFGELTESEKAQREIVELQKTIAEEREKIARGGVLDVGISDEDNKKIIADAQKRIAEIEIEEKERLELLKQSQQSSNQNNAANQMNENNIQQQLRGGGPPNMQTIIAPQTVASAPQTNNYSTPATTIVNTDPIVQAAMG